MLMIFLTLLAILGAIYVARGHPLMANSLWAVTNIGFIWHNIIIQEYEMAILFFVYELISVYGVYNLGFNKKSEP